MLKLSHGRFLGGPFLAHLPKITLFGAKNAVERPRITCFGNSIQFSWLVEGLNRLLPEIQRYPDIAQDMGCQHFNVGDVSGSPKNGGDKKLKQ